MDLHHNLFYTYHGPCSDTDRDRQLENNVTKALINTLRLGGEAVWRPFLAWLGIANATGADFLLQRQDLPSGHAAHKRHRVLLGISKRKSVWPPTQCAGPTYESLPDAWVYGDGFAVLVESKVGDNDFTPKHMQAHLSRLGSAEHVPPKIVLHAWRKRPQLLPQTPAQSDGRFLVPVGKAVCPVPGVQRNERVHWLSTRPF